MVTFIVLLILGISGLIPLWIAFMPVASVIEMVVALFVGFLCYGGKDD